MNISFVFFAINLSVLTCSCNTNQTIKINSEIKTAEVDTLILKKTEINKIVFLRMKISQEDTISGKYNTTISDIKYADGQIKKTISEISTFEPQFIYCDLIDSNNQRIETVTALNPLYKIIEYNDENDGQMKSRVIHKKSGEFTIRFNMTPQTAQISLYIADKGILKSVFNQKL